MIPPPSLDELPPPPPGTSGWPWTEASAALPPTLPDGRPWPRITVLTPSYNQGARIEEAMRSVLLQGYPDLEYVVLDGGSTDGSVETIRRYARWLARWTSEPDHGPDHAINVAAPRATGQLIGILPTSDAYLPDAFRRFAEAHARAPASLLMAPVEVCAENGELLWIERPSGVTLENALAPFLRPWYWHLLGMMVPAAVFHAAGPIDEVLPYCSDEDWLCRLLQRADVAYVEALVARWRRHANARTPLDPAAMVRVRLEIAERYWHLLPGLDRRRVRARHSVYEAGLHLAHHPARARLWDRGAGLRSLGRALREDPRIVAAAPFLRLVRRGLLPRRWLRSNPWSVAPS
jgi:glycosyltransferase involved in cell wall biosynthesis